MKNKLLNFFKNNMLYLLTFFISTIIIIILFIMNNVTPFGSQSLLCVDFYHQYGPMLAGLWNKVHNFSNIIYSFDVGLGLPTYRNFLNYLSSPFNIIMLFFNHKNLITSYSFIIGFKAVFASLSMVYYLSKKFNTKKLYLIPIGLIYAFSAYYQSYYWNIMWLDGMVFLPLITLGIENIVNKGTFKFYTICLAIMLFSNYFIGYMICIFSVIYFIFYLLYKTKFSFKHKREFGKTILKKGIKFAYASLLAGGIVAIFLIPLYFSMSSISATGGSIPTTQYYDFTLIDFLKGHLSGVTTTTFASDDITNPNVSAGILSIALLLAYILNIDIKFKNKLFYFFILGFFILAFFFAPLDYILHAFHVPNDLPYRYSFIYTFILLIIGTYSLVNLKKVKYPLLVIGYMFLMVLLLSISFDSWADLSKNMIYINMILLTLYFIFYTGIIYIDKYKNVLYIGFILIASIDVIISVDHNWDITQVLSVFYEDYNKTEEILNYEKKVDTSFYRTEKTNMMTLNDGAWYNYNGVNTFSSMAYESMASFQNHLGMPGNNINSYYYVQTTPLYDLMFDVKYTIGTNNDENRYSLIYTNDDLNLYRFDYNVGLIYGVNKNLLKWEYTNYNPFNVQNEYIELTSGVKDTFYKPNLINTEEIYKTDDITVLKYSYENTGDNMYFFEDSYSIDFFVIGNTLYYTDENYSQYTNEIDDLLFTYVDDYNEKNIINIASNDDQIEIYVGYSNYSENMFEMYSINQEKFNQAYEYYNKYKMDIKSFSDSKILGNMTVANNMIAYTSIPYDKGWKVYVDGKETKTYSIGDALLGFDIGKGTHEIKIVYKIPYIKVSSLISIISLLLIIFSKPLYKFLIKYKPVINFKKKKRKKIQI